MPSARTRSRRAEAARPARRRGYGGGGAPARVGGAPCGADRPDHLGIGLRGCAAGAAPPAAPPARSAVDLVRQSTRTPAEAVKPSGCFH
ncbi:hypothetical protein C3492_27365 [Streptomyces sp. Ru62]|nr:hypothetical protein C3492_27365 [Streptomyces sp. Ru62]